MLHPIADPPASGLQGRDSRPAASQLRSAGSIAASWSARGDGSGADDLVAQNSVGPSPRRTTSQSAAAAFAEYTASSGGPPAAAKRAVARSPRAVARP